MYEKARAFIVDALEDLSALGAEVTVEGVFWLHGEHDAWFGPYRPRYGARLEELIARLRLDLDRRELKWFLLGLSEKAPWGAERIAELNRQLVKLAGEDPHCWFVDTSKLPHRRIHFGAEGTLQLGEEMAEAYLTTR
jgi:hypothetical protein